MAAVLATLTLTVVVWTVASPRPARAATGTPTQISPGPTIPVTRPTPTTTPRTVLRTTPTTRPTPRTTAPATTRPVRTTVPRTVAPVVPGPVGPPVTAAPLPPTSLPAATLPAATTTTTTIAPIGGKLPNAPVTVPLQTRGSNAHVSPVFPVLSGIGFGLALLIAGARLFVTRPGGKDRRPLGDSPA